MPDYTIYALKVTGYSEAVYASLKQGEGRFGWSYVDTADLNSLKRKVEDGNSLTSDEKDCYQAFLLDLRPGDYVVYINVPSWGRCAVAQVKSGYYWKWADPDFNHRFGVDPQSVCDFDRNDAAVHPALAARLKLQGRKWRISLRHEFQQLLDALKAGRVGTPATSEDNLRFLVQDVKPLLHQITSRIHHTHPNTSLESLFAKIFKRVPGVIAVKLQGGAGDHGADILVTLEQAHPLTGEVEQAIWVVQVKSYEGQQGDTLAVRDLRRAFEHYPDADGGMIVSTADRTSEQFDAEFEHLKAETGKQVSLLIGADVAVFVLRYAGELLR